MTSDGGYLSLTDVANGAEVRLSAVSNWRARYADFPRPHMVSGQEVFDRDEIGVAPEQEDPAEPAQVGRTAGHQLRGPAAAQHRRDRTAGAGTAEHRISSKAADVVLVKGAVVRDGSSPRCA